MMPQIIATLGPADWAVENALSGETLAAACAAVAAAGYDGVYLPQGPGLFEPMEMAGYIAAADSSPLKIYIAQRAGLIAPTMCSRMFATLDQLSQGRVVAVLEAQADTVADGDILEPSLTLARAQEYAQIMHDLWGADKPLDHAGAHYRFNKARTNVPPLQKADLPIFLSCASDAVVERDAAFSGVVLSGSSLTQDAVARFVGLGLRVAVVVSGGAEHAPAAIGVYAKAGADTFMIAPASSHAALAAQHPRFIENCRATAAPRI